MSTEKKTCTICGHERPLDADNFRWREKDGKGYWTAQCRMCIKKAKAISRVRQQEKRKDGLNKIEELGVEAFLKASKSSGSNIPHTAELVEHVFNYFGGVGGFSAVMVKQYWDAAPGGSVRNRLLETMCRLVAKNVDSGGAKKPLQLWSEEELEQELEQRMQDAVATFTGVTIDVRQEESEEKQKAPKRISSSIADEIRNHEVSAGLLKRTPKRTSRKASGGTSSLPPEPESGGNPS